MIETDWARRPRGGTMRKWGLVISLFYTAAVILLLIPLTAALVGNWKTMAELHSRIFETYRFWATWICVAVFVFGQILLLVLTVDLTERRLKPRTHIFVSAIVSSLFLAILSSLALLSFALAIRGDRTDDWTLSLLRWIPLAGWVVWGIVFYRYARGTQDAVTRAVKWLLRGSVLELLIAVPSHVIVRRRDDCCAPIGTGIGISTGLAIMLLSFGPSVIFLYQKRMEKLKPQRR
jgi:hypothetical protein